MFNAAYTQLGREFALMLTAIPKFYLQKGLLHFAIRKRFANKYLDSLSFIAYLFTGLPITLGYLFTLTLEKYVTTPLFGSIFNKIGTFIEAKAGLKAPNVSGLIAYFGQDLFPKSFHAGLTLTVMASLLQFFAPSMLLNYVAGSLFNFFALGASSYFSYRFLKAAAIKLSQFILPKSPSDSLTQLVDRSENIGKKNFAVEKFFRAFKRLINNDIYIGDHSYGKLIIESVKPFIEKLKLPFQLKTNQYKVEKQNTEKSITRDELIQSYLQTINFVNRHADNSTFTTAHSIQWLHGTSSGCLAGLEFTKDQIKPFGKLFDTYAPYTGELGAGVQISGINNSSLSGVTPVNTATAWESYADSFVKGAAVSLLDLNFSLYGQLARVFQPDGQVKKQVSYREILNLLISLKRLKQWHPSSFEALLQFTGSLDTWLFSKINKTPFLEATPENCLKNLITYLEDIENNNSVTKSLKSWLKDYNIQEPLLSERLQEQIQQYKDKAKVARALLEEPGKPLATWEKDITICGFPILLGSTHIPMDEVTVIGSCLEVLWNTDSYNENGLKLGVDIDIIITDTQRNVDRVNNTLAQKHITGVQCMTYSEYSSAINILPNLLDKPMIFGGGDSLPSKKYSFTLTEAELEASPFFPQKEVYFTNRNRSSDAIEQQAQTHELRDRLKAAFCSN